MFDVWTDLLGCLNPHRVSDPADAGGVLEFEGVSQQLDYHREALLRFRPGDESAGT